MIYLVVALYVLGYFSTLALVNTGIKAHSSVGVAVDNLYKVWGKASPFAFFSIILFWPLLILAGVLTKVWKYFA